MVNIMKSNILAFAAIVMLFNYTNSHSVSFDCSKAKSRSENLICSDPELSALEDEFTTLYKNAKSVVADKKEFNRINKAEWQWRETACIDKECLRGWYSRRNEQLKVITSKTANEKQTIKQETNKPLLDYSKEIFTIDYAIICPQSLFFDIRADHGIREIYGVYTSFFGTSEKAQKLGCAEWKGGIRVYARRMTSPLEDFVSISLSPNENSTMFTMEPHLTNQYP